ncbi:F-box protein CPR30-like protein [Tanacetum coccineum]
MCFNDQILKTGLAPFLVKRLILFSKAAFDKILMLNLEGLEIQDDRLPDFLYSWIENGFLLFVIKTYLRNLVDIYSVKTATWREVIFPQHLPRMYFKEAQVFLKGCVHWIAYERWKTNVPHCSIMTFDLSTEIFEEIQLPICFVCKPPASLEVAVVNQQLVVVFSKNLHLPRASASNYIIWVMKEYKNPTSWTMMWNVKYDRDMGRVLQLTDSGEIIMGSIFGEFDYHVGYYDPHCLGFINKESIYVDRYEESLALLNIGQSVGTEDIIKEEEDLQE